MNLSKNIKHKRQELKLSQEYVADKLGVSRQAVSKWETGRSEPTANNLVELAALFEISLSELVDPVQYAAKPEILQRKAPKGKNYHIFRINLSNRPFGKKQK